MSNQLTKNKTPRPNRWPARPVWSTLLRVLVLVVPVAAGVGAAILLSNVLPRPNGLLWMAFWWVALFVTSATVASLTDRVARRLIPLAVLLGLTMIFPDRAPSRFAVARRIGNIKNLQERIRHAKEHGIESDPARAAETILTLVSALNVHDRKTRGHSERVRALTDMLASELRLDGDARDRLRWAALLHDIGKLEVEARVLNKPGKPTPPEWESLKRHPEEGARIAAPLLPWLGEWGMAIEQHHERFDGRGYPRGMAGHDLSMAGRILTVTDSFETMTAARSYKKPMSVVNARRELANCAGGQFDPVIVRSFLNISLGRLMWQVGPASWLAQLPFVGVRAITAPLATAAKFAVGGLARAMFGLAAIGATGLMNLPAQADPRPAAGPAAEATVDDKRPAAKDRPATRADDRPGRDDEGERDGNDDTKPEPSDGPEEDPDGGLGDRVEDTLEDPVGTIEDIAEDPVGEVVDVVDDVVDVVEDPVGEVSDAVEDVGDVADDLLGGL